MTNDAWRFTPTADVLGRRRPADPDRSQRLFETGYLFLHRRQVVSASTTTIGVSTALRRSIRKLDDKPDHLAAYPLLPGRLPRHRWTRGRERFHLQCAPTGLHYGSYSARLKQNRTVAELAGTLRLLAILNTYLFDWLLQLRVRSH